MKKLLYSIMLVCSSQIAISQVPIYIYFGSHNETNDETFHGLNYLNPLEYATMKTYVQSVCDTLTYYGASYEMMVESNFIRGTLACDNGYLSNNDILEWADNQPNIEVQSHNHFDTVSFPPNPYNSTDLVYLLDSCGVDTAYVLGGFIWTDFVTPPVPEDWTQWQTPQPGYTFANAPFWQPTLLWGGGSPGHQDDFEAYGIWRPTDASVSGFGTHNEFGTLVNFGNGCGPEFILEDTTNEVLLAYRIMNFVDSVQTYYAGNPDAFFNMKVMLNFKHFPSTGYIDKLNTVLSLINPYILTGKMEYMGIMDIYQEWTTLHPLAIDSFVVECQNTVQISNATPLELGVDEVLNNESTFTVFPNPTSGECTITFNDDAFHTIFIYDLTGKVIYQTSGNAIINIDLNSIEKGMYLINTDNSYTTKLIVD